jgi:hypothetical protein
MEEEGHQGGCIPLPVQLLRMEHNTRSRCQPIVLNHMSYATTHLMDFSQLTLQGQCLTCGSISC